MEYPVCVQHMSTDHKKIIVRVHLCEQKSDTGRVEKCISLCAFTFKLLFFANEKNILYNSWGTSPNNKLLILGCAAATAPKEHNSINLVCNDQVLPEKNIVAAYFVWQSKMRELLAIPPLVL